MNVRWTISLAAGTAVLLCGTLLGTAAEPNLGQNQSAMQGSAGIQISTLMGTTVLDPQSKEVGSIKDVLLDAHTGQATFVILDAEVAASGHAMLVVPYQALRMSVNSAEHRQSVVLDLRPDRLHAAPQIRNNQSQTLQNPQFLEQARNFYQPRTYTAARPIENPSMPPSLPIQPAVRQPYVVSANPSSGWTRDLETFYNE